MPTNHECICCCEVETVVNKFQESENDISCITHHEGFESVCLNVWILQTAYFNYRQHYCIYTCILATDWLVLGMVREESELFCQVVR